MDKVMGGIAEALIATGVGLFVAIPAVVAYNVFQKQIGDIEDNVSSICKRLCAFIAVGKATATGSRPSEAPPTDEGRRRQRARSRRASTRPSRRRPARGAEE